MRKILYLLPAVLMIAFVSSCDKDDDNNEPEKFSQLSVEENKEIVEQSAILMAETAEDILTESNFQLAGTALQESAERPDPWQVAVSML